MSDTPVHPSCPAPRELEAFSRGDLPGEVLEALAEHLTVCADCATLLETIPNADDPVVSALGRLREAPALLESLPADLLAVLGAPSTGLPGSEVLPSKGAGAADPLTQLREYRVLEKLGEGGMGSVYRAVHSRLEKVVAVKVLTGATPANPLARARFEREMKAVGALNHPNIVQAFDAGEAEGRHFLVMELVQGVDLARLVGCRGPLTPADACEAIRQTALGLQHAHERGLIHRDVKPSNLMLTPTGQVKLLDLGLARIPASGQAAGDSTASQVVMGSYDYMAPEQADDPHAVDARADLYSLGCTLYHLLTGRPPFAAVAHTPMQKMKAHAHTPVPTTPVLQSGAPRDLVRLLERLLAKEPGQRPGSAAEVAQALLPFTRGHNLARLLEPEQTAVTRTPSRKNQGNARPAGGDGSRLVLIVGAAIAFTLLLALAGVIYVRTDQGILEIESDDREVKVLLEQGGKVTLLDLKTRKTFPLTSGTYRLKSGEAANDLVLETDHFVMKRGAKVVVRVRRVPAPPPVHAAGSPVVLTPKHTLRGHNDWIWALAFSPDGRHLASGADDQTVRVWDARTGQLRHVFKGHEQRISCVAFSPDSKTLASVGLDPADADVRLWDVNAGRQRDALKGLSGWVWAVAFSPDGELLAIAGGEGKSILLWDLKKRAKRHDLPAAAGGHIRRLAFFAAGQTLAGAGPEILFWDTKTGKLKKRIEHDQTSGLQVSSDGRLIAAAHWSTGAVTLFDGETGKKVASWQAHKGYLNDLALSPNGKLLASSGSDGFVRLWDTVSRKELAALAGHEGAVDPLAFSPDGGTLASGGKEDRTVRLWDVSAFGGRKH